MATTPNWPNLQAGMSGNNIYALQCLLNFRKNSTPVNGVFDTNTKDATVAFQKSNGLSPDGVAGQGTLSKLISTVSTTLTNDPNVVKAAQYLLKKFEAVTVNGTFDSSTSTTTKSFQTKIGLSPSGTIDTTTWQYLFGCNAYWSNWANALVTKAKSVVGKEIGYFPSTFTPGNWCVDFVCWCASQCGLLKSNIMPSTSSSNTMLNWFKTNQPDTVHTGTSGIQTGDIAFFKYAADSIPHHTAIVASSVNASTGKVDTINGNWGYSNPPICVKSQPMPYDTNDAIAWYVHPHYEYA